jgi:hypothetical protein
MRKSILILFLSFYAVVAHADIDWGGGQTQFSGESGAVLGRESGTAVLISVRAGELIDFESFVPNSPADLVTPGTTLSAGANVNSVLATSREFYSGYLLNSAIPDLLIDEQELLGVHSGETLFVVVWDADTFVDDLPTDDSYFTVLPLYFDGNDSSAPAQTSGDAFSIFTNRVHPAESLVAEDLQLMAQFGGFNSYSGFSEWAESIHLVADGSLEETKYLDSNGNGRSNLEEYAFQLPPAIGRVSASVEAEPNARRTELTVQLRGNDPLLNYSLDVSENLKTWETVDIAFVDQQWVCSDGRIEITASTYEGLGVWSVGLAYVDPDVSSTFFKFRTAIN